MKFPPNTITLAKLKCLTLLVFVPYFLAAQQDVFNRNNSGTGNWWDGANPWFYQFDGNRARPDDFTRNDVYIGHNNNNPMTVNGAFFQLRDLNIQSTVTINRTYNAASGGGISLSKGFYSASANLQTFNVPFGVDGANVDFQAQSGNVLFTSDLFLNNNNAVFDGPGIFTLDGPITGTGGSITKNGTGITVFTNAGNTYSGATQINNGTIQLNPVGNTSLSTTFILNGGTLSTSFIATNRIINTSGNLRLDLSSNIQLQNDIHELRFSNSSGITWNSSATLTIFGWQGLAATSGTAGKIYIGNNSSALTTAQLSQINFDGYAGGAMLLSDGELVPAPNTLPVIMSNFWTTCTNNGSIVINWQTLSEVNAMHFKIERSADGSDWEAIATVDAQGTTNQISNYSFTDNTPHRGQVNYYRLLQKDFDGEFEFFGPIGEHCDTDNFSIIIFPNPAKDKIQLSITSNNIAEPLKVAIFDTQGKNVFSQTFNIQEGNNLIPIDISSFASGNYLLKAESANTQRKSIHKINKI